MGNKFPATEATTAATKYLLVIELHYILLKNWLDANFFANFFKYDTNSERNESGSCWLLSIRPVTLLLRNRFAHYHVRSIYIWFFIQSNGTEQMQNRYPF